MLINKIVQSLAKNISAKGNLKPVLAGVYFQNNKAVATDTFKLSEITFKETNINDIPDIRGFTPKDNLNGVISSEDILNIKIPKSKTTILNNAFIGNVFGEFTPEGKRELSIATTDLKKSNVANTTEVEGFFPDYSNFSPDQINLEVGMDIAHLEDIIKLYKSAGVKTLKFGFKDGLSPIEINAEYLSEEIEGIRSILLPVKLFNN